MPLRSTKRCLAVPLHQLLCKFNICSGAPLRRRRAGSTACTSSSRRPRSAPRALPTRLLLWRTRWPRGRRRASPAHGKRSRPREVCDANSDALPRPACRLVAAAGSRRGAGCAWMHRGGEQCEPRCARCARRPPAMGGLLAPPDGGIRARRAVVYRSHVPMFECRRRVLGSRHHSSPVRAVMQTRGVCVRAPLRGLKCPILLVFVADCSDEREISGVRKRRPLL